MRTIFLAYSSAQLTVFGPEIYVREKGKPRNVVKYFSVGNPSADCILVVENGEAGKHRTSSADSGAVLLPDASVVDPVFLIDLPGTYVAELMAEFQM